MAWLERRGQHFHIDFRFGDQRFKKSLKTSSQQEARELKTRVERKLRLIEQGDLEIPDGMDVAMFVVSGGRLRQSVSVKKKLQLEELFQRYLEGLPSGALEENSLYTVKIHLNHCLRVLGKRFEVSRLTTSDLQHYVRQRCKQKGRSGKPLSATTIKKELTTFSGVWRWAGQMDILEGPFPNKGIRYPKTDEKPPFQTWKEIETQISRGGLSETEQRELWDCLFLTVKETQQVLEFVRRNARNPFVYPMVVLAAHTGARRSELVRSEVHDFDFEGNLVRLRERKRTRGRRTTRSVPLSALARETMIEWSKRPNGRHTFSRDGSPLTVDIASDHFRRTLSGNKWEKIRGWHVFRHSFISNCAAKGIDQRIIDAWSGHQTEAMRRRYTHLFPECSKQRWRQYLGGSKPSD